MPDALLTKPSPLTPGELAIMRRHVELGAEILQATGALASIAPLVLTSHEWFNGGGYPRRLAGSDIPLATRIITVVDAYDAMTQDRSYRLGIARAGRRRRALALHADAVRPRHRHRVSQRPRHSLKFEVEAVPARPHSSASTSLIWDRSVPQTDIFSKCLPFFVS